MWIVLRLREVRETIDGDDVNIHAERVGGGGGITGRGGLGGVGVAQVVGREGVGAERVSLTTAGRGGRAGSSVGGRGKGAAAGPGVVPLRGAARGSTGIGRAGALRGVGGRRVRAPALPGAAGGTMGGAFGRVGGGSVALVAFPRPAATIRVAVGSVMFAVAVARGVRVVLALTVVQGGATDGGVGRHYLRHNLSDQKVVGVSVGAGFGGSAVDLKVIGVPVVSVRVGSVRGAGTGVRGRRGLVGRRGASGGGARGGKCGWVQWVGGGRGASFQRESGQCTAGKGSWAVCVPKWRRWGERRERSGGPSGGGRGRRSRKGVVENVVPRGWWWVEAQQSGPPALGWTGGGGVEG